MSRHYEALSRLSIDYSKPKAPPLAPTSVNTVIAEPLGVEDKSSMKAQPSSRLVALTEPESMGAEKFRALVTRLDHLRQQRSLKSLQVTSSVTNEGKTFVAMNLAVTLAKYSGSKSLLIEGDLHRPTLSSLLGLGESRGVTHWWSGNEDITHFLHRLDGMPLWFLAAGEVCSQPSNILRSTRFADAFSRLVGEFEWIVVDSTPMSPIVDANLWSRLVDGTLLVVRVGLTPLKALKRGLEALDHPKLVGVVLNETLESDHSGYNGKYYRK